MKEELKNAIRVAADWKTWSSKRKLLVIESDDWGAVRMPQRESLKGLPEDYRKYYKSPYYRFDTIANSEDLNALFEVLSRHHDSNGNPAVITANAIMANPDFQAIIKSNYQTYFYKSFRETLKEYYSDNVWSLWHEGINAGLFHPQLHGREHVDVQRWMCYLRNGNKVYRDACQRGIYAVDYHQEMTKSNLTAALDVEREEDIYAKTEALKEAIQIFKENFVRGPQSFIAPSYTWNSSIEQSLAEGGVQFIQGIRTQKVPIIGQVAGYRYVKHYLGEQNQNGQTYMVRNVFFEPSLMPQANTLKETMSRINWAFRFGKPAIIGSHRINYIGAIDSRNRERNLALLDQLLMLVKKKWPTVEFLSSNQLGVIINESRS